MYKKNEVKDKQETFSSLERKFNKHKSCNQTWTMVSKHFNECLDKHDQRPWFFGPECEPHMRSLRSVGEDCLKITQEFQNSLYHEHVYGPMFGTNSEIEAKKIDYKKYCTDPLSYAQTKLAKCVKENGSEYETPCIKIRTEILEIKEKCSRTRDQLDESLLKQYTQIHKENTFTNLAPELKV